MNGVKAAELVMEENAGLYLLRTYAIYALDSSDSTVSVFWLREVEVDVSKETGVNGSAILARDRLPEKPDKVLIDVDSCNFLEAMGELNKEGKLVTIALTGEY
jgi:hypothetical protein